MMMMTMKTKIIVTKILYIDIVQCMEVKKNIEENLISEALKVIFKENTFWDLAFQAITWLSQEIDQPIPSLCSCGKITKSG